MRVRFHGGLFLVLWLTSTIAPSQNFTYTNTNGTITITGYNGPGGNVTIPDTISGLPVTRIGTRAFFNQISLSQIAMGNSVSAIGDITKEERTRRRSIICRAGLAGVPPLRVVRPCSGIRRYKRATRALVPG